MRSSRHAASEQLQFAFGLTTGIVLAVIFCGTIHYLWALALLPVGGIFQSLIAANEANRSDADVD